MKSPAACPTTVACLLLFFLVGAGCSAPTASSPPALANSEVPADLAQGRAYFLRECGQCHRIFRPEERTPDAWQPILARKAARVSLTKAQYEKLSAYVLAASKAAQPTP